MLKFAVSSTNSTNLLFFTRIMSTRPVFSLIRNSTKIAPNCNSKFFGTFADIVEQQQQQHQQLRNHNTSDRRNSTIDLPSISCKDSRNGPKQEFSFNVARNVLQDGLKKTPQENLLCSPISTSAVLNMLVPGSKGQTFDQFVDLLCLNEDKLNKSSMRLLDVVRPFKAGDGPAPNISFSNSVWVDQQCPLMQSYKELLENVHAADVNSVDLLYKADEVMEEVNSWSRTKTKGMIKSILPEISYYNETVMILANALHFECKNNSDKMLDTSGAQLYYCGNFEGSEVLRLPLKQEASRYTAFRSTHFNNCIAGQNPRSFSMYVFVPTEKIGLPHNRSSVEGQKMSLSEFIEELKVDEKAFQKKISRRKEVISEFMIPTFNVESEVSLSSTMQQLGLTLPFKAGKNDLMRFVDSPLSELLFVTDITQKTRIKTNMKGTTFSVVTYTTLNGPAHRFPATPLKQKFVADNPFLFMIQDDFSGAVVSVGTMLSTALSS